MTTTPPRLRLTAAVDADNTPTLYRDGRVVAVRRDTPADPQHLAAPPALDPDVYDLLAAVADPGEAVLLTIARRLATTDRPHLTNPAAIDIDADGWLWAVDTMLDAIRELVRRGVVVRDG